MALWRFRESAKVKARPIVTTTTFIKDEFLTTPEEMTARLKSLMNISEDRAQRLVERGASTDWVDEDGRTPFIIAAANGWTSFMDAMLKRGTDPDERDRDPEKGWTALYWATFEWKFESMAFLIKANADVNARNGKLEKTPMMTAATFTSKEGIDILSAAGADPALVDAKGRNCLDWTYKKDKSKNIGKRFDEAQDAIHRAVTAWNMRVVAVFNGAVAKPEGISQITTSMRGKKIKFDFSTS